MHPLQVRPVKGAQPAHRRFDCSGVDRERRNLGDGSNKPGPHRTHDDPFGIARGRCGAEPRSQRAVNPRRGLAQHASGDREVAVGAAYLDGDAPRIAHAGHEHLRGGEVTFDAIPGAARP